VPLRRIAVIADHLARSLAGTFAQPIQHERTNARTHEALTLLRH